MLKQRLVVGILMAGIFAAVVIADGWMDGSITSSCGDDKPIQATGFCILIVLIIIPAHTELAKLAAAKNLKLFRPLSTAAAILFAINWYLLQFFPVNPQLYLSLLSVIVLLSLFLYQHLRYGNTGVLANCGVNYLCIIYTGLLSSFCLAIRISFGLWPLLMFISVVKSADIGAYITGKLFGRHKFSPKISPGKTWEGMAGAVVFSTIASVLFARFCDIMSQYPAVIFGFCFAFIGQLGDLVESMLKRDAQQKDSSENVPGFGGILDIVDSLLVAGPFAYVFFMFSG